jgi:hypothetical protein
MCCGRNLQGHALFAEPPAVKPPQTDTEVVKLRTVFDLKAAVPQSVGVLLSGPSPARPGSPTKADIAAKPPPVPKRSLASKLRDIQSTLALGPQPWKAQDQLMAPAHTCTLDTQTQLKQEVSVRACLGHSSAPAATGEHKASSMKQVLDKTGGHIVMAAEAASTMHEGTAYLHQCRAAMEPCAAGNGGLAIK